MPQVAEQIPFTLESTPNRFRWTRAQCDAIQEIGVLNGRCELIDGEIISKMGQKPPHRQTLILLHAWLIAVFGVLFVQTQSTIEVGDADPDHNGPEPDATVTIEPTTAYSDRNPGPSDIVMAAEVSDSTLRFDRIAKAALYARAGIREYWIIDIAGRRVFVHRNASPEGYSEVTEYGADEMISSLARPDEAVLVSDLFPPVRA